MSATVLTLPFAPPDYDLSDDGSSFWPHDPWQLVNDWPFVAEAWQKWDHDYERIAKRDWQKRLRCEHKRWLSRDEFIPGQPPYLHCRAEGVGEWWAREHGMSVHPGEAVSFNYVHARWVYEMMGCADLYDGKPTGWYTMLDPRRPSVHRFEDDALELGYETAEWLWNEAPA